MTLAVGNAIWGDAAEPFLPKREDQFYLTHCLLHRVCGAQVEKHWTEKALSDMTERDWRIFREDFNIGYRGVNTVLPIRNWEEAGLPEPLKKVGAAAALAQPHALVIVKQQHYLSELQQEAPTHQRVHNCSHEHTAHSCTAYYSVYGPGTPEPHLRYVVQESLLHVRKCPKTQAALLSGRDDDQSMILAERRSRRARPPRRPVLWAPHSGWPGAAERGARELKPES